MAKKTNCNHNNRIYKEFIERACQSLKSVNDSQQRIANSLSFINIDNLTNTKIDKALRPYALLNSQLDELLRSVNLQSKVPDTSHLLQQFKSEQQKLTVDAILKDFASSMNSASDVLDNIMNAQQRQWTNILESIPNSVFANINFTNIQMDKFNKLAAYFTEINLDEGINLTDDEFHEVHDAIIYASDGMAGELNEFLNKLMQYALTATPHIKAFLFTLIKGVIIGYIVAVLCTYYPPTALLRILNLSKVDVLQQASQQTINKYPPEELSKYRLVCVTDLNVRSKPSVDAPIISGLTFGDEIKILQKQEEWILIQWSDMDGAQIKGWVKERYITKPRINKPVAE